MIPKESEGELFEDALARVKRCVGGGTETENADSDSDLEVVADFIPVNLRCPVRMLMFVCLVVKDRMIFDFTLMSDLNFIVFCGNFFSPQFCLVSIRVNHPQL